MAVIKLNKTENNNEGRNVRVITAMFKECIGRWKLTELSGKLPGPYN